MIDSSDLCSKHLTGGSTLIEARTDLGQYIKITKVSQPLGTYPFQLQSTTTKIHLLVQNPAASPIVSIPLSKKIEFIFQSVDNWRVVDPKGKTWTLLFRDPNEARRVAAAIGVVSVVTDPDKPAIFDLPGIEGSGKVVNGGDTVKVSVYEFGVDPFPIVGKLIGSQSASNGTITPTRTPLRYFDQLAGMRCGTTRVVYLPSSPETGNPTVYVVELLRAKFRSSDASAADLEPEPAQATPVGTPPSSSPPVSPGTSEASDPAPAEDDTGQKKPDVMWRLLKMGAVGSALAVPVKPKPESEAPAETVSKPAEPVAKTPAPAPAAEPAAAPRSVAAAIAANENRRLEERLEAFERSLEAQLELLVQPRPGSDLDTVIAGITALNVQLRTKQSNLEQLQRSLEEVRAKNSQNPIAREADAVRRELEEQKKRAVALAGKVKEQTVQLEDLERRIGDRRQLAQSKATQIVKGLMGQVFSETADRFEEDGRYTGAEISSELFQTLKNEAETVLNRLSQEGLL
jgi:predicted Holliday junction resolvase-like endonuclease